MRTTCRRTAALCERICSAVGCAGTRSHILRAPVPTPVRCVRRKDGEGMRARARTERTHISSSSASPVTFSLFAASFSLTISTSFSTFPPFSLSRRLRDAFLPLSREGCRLVPEYNIRSVTVSCNLSCFVVIIVSFPLEIVERV